MPRVARYARYVARVMPRRRAADDARVLFDTFRRLSTLIFLRDARFLEERECGRGVARCAVLQRRGAVRSEKCEVR